MAQASKTQIDRLGDRLKSGALDKSDLILLDGYRRSFGPTYETVVQTIRNAIALEPSGRPAKSTNSLTEKLKRESIRLTQVQDIAGCRIVVPDVPEQERVVDSLIRVFSGARVTDRREKPSYEYRAVHVVVEVLGKPVEIQVRTSFSISGEKFRRNMLTSTVPRSSMAVVPKKFGGLLKRCQIRSLDMRIWRDGWRDYVNRIKSRKFEKKCANSEWI